MRPLTWRLSAWALALTLTPSLAPAQQSTPHRMVEWNLDSGPLSSESRPAPGVDTVIQDGSSSMQLLFEETVYVAEASWLRLFFSEAELGQTSDDRGGAMLRLTSLEDGAVQTLDSESVRQWQNSSAFFNGDSVRVELLAPAGSETSRVAIHEVMVGELWTGAPESICGPTDDRTLSMDPRQARVVPVGCTVWLIDDAEGCFLTAGHCISGGSLHVVEFNVPLSDANGAVNHPGPEDQYPVDLSSIQGTDGGIGNDWAYFGAFPNSQNQLSPLEVQGSTYVLGSPPATTAGETIRITGYGTTTGTQGTPQSWSQVQTTHLGPLTVVTPTNLQYATDTTGGDSGSPIIHETGGGNAIGIHTHAGCSSGGGANNGTNIGLAAIQNALASPAGVCDSGQRPLRIDVVGAIADPLALVDPGFQVSIVDRGGSPATLNSATLVYNAGAGDQSVPLVSLGGGLWQADFPPLACAGEPTFRVDAESSGGITVSYPYSADPSVDRRLRRWVGSGFDVIFRDTFETDQGWTVDDDPGLSDGSWERGVPSGYGFRQDPPWDADTVGDGRAYLTALAGGNTDVDGGSTRLISPALDASSGSDPHISYWRWWDDGGPGAPSDDSFVVEISNDNGSNWTLLEEIGPGVDGDWVRPSFRVADFVTPTNQVRLRFTATDAGTGNVIEAGVDGVVLAPTAGVPVLCEGIFADGFESGDTNNWSN